METIVNTAEAAIAAASRASIAARAIKAHAGNNEIDVLAIAALSTEVSVLARAVKQIEAEVRRLRQEANA